MSRWGFKFKNRLGEGVRVGNVWIEIRGQTSETLLNLLPCRGLENLLQPPRDSWSLWGLVSLGGKVVTKGKGGSRGHLTLGPFLAQDQFNPSAWHKNGNNSSNVTIIPTEQITSPTRVATGSEHFDESGHFSAAASLGKHLNKRNFNEFYCEPWADRMNPLVLTGKGPQEIELNTGCNSRPDLTLWPWNPARIPCWSLQDLTA